MTERVFEARSRLAAWLGNAKAGSEPMVHRVMEDVETVLAELSRLEGCPQALAETVEQVGKLKLDLQRSETKRDGLRAEVERLRSLLAVERGL